MARINLFDRTLKVIARNHADLFLRLAFPDLPVRLVGTLENVEVSLPTRPVDFVHRVEHEGGEYILHIEFQLAHEAGFPRRLCVYHGMLSAQFDVPVLTMVVYLRPRRVPPPEDYVTRLGSRVVNRFSYPVIELSDYVDDICSGRYRELAPLLVVLVPDPDSETLQLARSLILAEPDERKRGELLSLAVTVAARYFDKEFLWRFFREEVELMREASFVADWIEEAMEQGAQQGHERGLREGLREGLLKGIELALELKFGKEGTQLLPTIYTIEDVAVLQAIHAGIRTADTPDDLRRIYESS